MRAARSDAAPKLGPPQVFALQGRSLGMAGLAQFGGGVLSMIAGGIGVAKILHFRQLIETMKGDAAPDSLEGAMKGLMANATRLGTGLYVLVVASVAVIIAIVALRSKREAAAPLPLHSQRITVILVALAGAGATFMPWAGPVDAEPAVKIDASRSSAQTIGRSRATNRVCMDSVRFALGQPDRAIQGMTSSPGTARRPGSGPRERSGGGSH